MKHLKDNGFLSDIAYPDPATPHSTTTSKGTDLSLIADQLLAIAGALRPNATDQTVSRRGLIDSGKSDADAAAKTSGPSDAISQSDQKRLAHAALAREAYARRRERAVIFGNAELFGEPAWDILLDLYVAHAEGKTVSVSSACIGSAAPPTTGLRWLGVLSDQGLIVREHDPEDQRRVLVRLSDTGLAAMDEYFSKARSEN